MGIAEDLPYFARELAYVAAADQRRLAELDTVRAKLELLRCEFEDYCKEIRAAGANFHCREAPETQAGEEASAAFFDRETLLDRLSRELGRPLGTCTGSAPRSEAAQ